MEGREGGEAAAKLCLEHSSFFEMGAAEFVYRNSESPATWLRHILPWCTRIRAQGPGPITVIQGLGTSDCKTELCTRHLVANSSIDRRAPTTDQR
jgi:hypothetical protein